MNIYAPRILGFPNLSSSGFVRVLCGHHSTNRAKSSTIHSALLTPVCIPGLAGGRVKRAGRIRWQSLVPLNQGFPDKIQEPDLPVAMWTSSFLFFIPNRSASALVHPKGTRSNV